MSAHNIRTEWTPEQISPLAPRRQSEVRPIDSYRRVHEACAFSDAVIRREQTTRVERLRYVMAGLLAVMGRTR